MKTISGLSNLGQELKDTVVVIGVFDGLHRGHRYLINRAVSRARSSGRKSVCITFDPHPQGQPYLISLKHRLKEIAELGIDYCLVIAFNKKFAGIKAGDFIQNILVRFFHPRYVWVGADFRFGYQAQGDIGLLEKAGGDFGFKLKAVKKIRAGSRIISSRSIRGLINSGKLTEARRLLGQRVTVLGTVIEGSKRGRILGYPTANINPHHEVLPKEGVYAVKILYRSQEYSGLCNIGKRPTFPHYDDRDKTIEAHLFDFKQDLYGQDLEIQFVKKIREEKKFPRSSLLVQQIQKDSRKARQILKNIF